MKRLAAILAAALAVVSALGLLAAIVLPRDALRARLGEQISAWTGRDVSLRGEPEISFFPELAVTLRDVQVAGPPDMPDAPVIAMDGLRGTVKLLPLLIGDIRFASFAMERPQLRLVVDAQGRRNWDFNSGSAALQLAFAGDVPLGNFAINDGSVSYDNRRTSVSERVDAVDLRLDWTSVRNPLSLAGRGSWRGEQVEISSAARNPFAALQGRSTPIEARIQASPVSLDFKGEASDLGDLRLSGALSLASPSLRVLSTWLGRPMPPGSTLGPLSLEGAAVLHDSRLAVDNAEVRLDDNSATGAVAVSFRSKPSVTGTLAFRSLDLTPYFTGFSGTFAPGRDWRRVGIATGWLQDLSADIRLSAETVTAARFTFGETAASVSLRDGRLEIGVGRATFARGVLSGTLGVTDKPFPDAPAADVQLRADGVDLAQAVSGADTNGPAGSVTLSTDLTSRGRDLGSLFTGMNGDARLDAADARIPGLDPADWSLVDRASDRPAASSATVSVIATLGGGHARLESLSVTTRDTVAKATGTIALDDGALDLAGAIKTPSQPGASPATQPAAPGAGAASAAPAMASPVAFTLEGTVFRPAFQAALP